MQAFVNAILEECQASPGSRDAIESLRVAIAATRSLKEGRSVFVAEVA
jgi:myo-inositol 2-dehydrogenase/D-chiro-inositol 1-dehydrogenase